MSSRGARVICQTCGAELTEGAKFCSNCGAPVGSDAEETMVVEPATERTAAERVDEALAVLTDETAADEVEADEELPTVVVPVTEPEAEPDVDAEAEVDEAPEDMPTVAHPRSGAMPADNTTTAVPSGGVLHDVLPTPARPKREPRERRKLEEHGAFEEFVGAIWPLLRAPRVSGNVLGAAIAFLIVFFVTALIWVARWDAIESLIQPRVMFEVSSTDDDFGAIATLGMLAHQVPLVGKEGYVYLAPFLLVLLPLAACAAGLTLARRVMPCSGRPHGFLNRNAPFAIAYGVLVSVWSLFGVEGWHGSHFWALLIGAVIAYVGAWTAEHWIPVQQDRAAEEAMSPPPARGRFREALRAGTRVLCLLLLIGGIGWFIGSTVEVIQTQSEGEGTPIASNALDFVEGGFEALGFGVLAEQDNVTPGEKGSANDQLRVWELDEAHVDATYAIYLITALLIVLVGGLFSGFAIARRVRPRSRNDHALYGAVTGLVWAGAMVLAQLVVLPRFQLGDGDTVTFFDGGQAVFFSLVFGALLGGLGGLLAARAFGEAPAAIENAADAVAGGDAAPDSEPDSEPGSEPA